jgi:hypothetical protein
LAADGDGAAMDGIGVAAGGGGGVELHCTRTAPATVSVTIGHTSIGDERLLLDLI